MHDMYSEHLMSHTKKLEDNITDNSTSLEANTAVSNYIQAYSPSDEYIDNDGEFI